MIRWRRYVKWTMVAATVGVIATLIVSHWFQLSANRGVHATAGWIHVYPRELKFEIRPVAHYTPGSTSSLSTGFTGLPRILEMVPLCRSRSARNAPGEKIVMIPGWIVTVGLAAPTALLFWLDNRRHPPGHCRQCGYDLRGSESGTCSECGTQQSATENHGF